MIKRVLEPAADAIRGFGIRVTGFLLILCLLLLPVRAAAETTIYVSDQGAPHVGYCHDNQLSSGGLAAVNWGGNVNFAVGDVGNAWDFVPILRFGLSPIPANATITGVALGLQCITFNSNETVTIYQLAAGNAGWPEGTEDGVAQVGSSCWNKHTYNTVSWVNGAVWLTSGNWIDTALGSVLVDGTGAFQIVLNSSGIAAVQNAITSGAFEFVLTGSDYATDHRILFASSENETVSYRPYLEVTYEEASRAQVIIVDERPW